MNQRSVSVTRERQMENATPAGSDSGLSTRALAPQPAARAREGRGPRTAEETAEFLAMMSHELRTPLTTISGNARLLRRNAARLTQGQKEQALDDISAEAERMGILVNDLMMLARLDGESAVKLEPVPVREVVEGVVRSHRRLHPRRPLSIMASRASYSVAALGVAGYIEQIVQNLLTNAEKYSGPAAPVEVRLDQEPESVAIRVMDRGIGIDSREAAKLFARFHRSARGAEHAPGTGVGLTVCKRLSDAMHARIWALPRQGGGSEFGLSLQRVRQRIPRAHTTQLAS